MFDRNEWLKWAQNTQETNTDMRGFRHEYWRKNNPLSHHLYEVVSTSSTSDDSGDPRREHDKKRSGTSRKSSSDIPNNPTDSTSTYIRRRAQAEKENIGASKATPKVAQAVNMSKKGSRIGAFLKAMGRKGKDSDMINIAKQAAAWQFGSMAVDKLTPSGRKRAEAEKRSSPTRVQGQPQQVQEMGAQGWKNVAKGAKAVDAASTALTVGSIIAAPFTGGLSLAGLGAAAALKGGTKLATTAATKGATKMATKMAAKQAVKQTLKQKAVGFGKQAAKDVATGAAMSAGMSAVTPKPKSPTTAVSTRPPTPAPATDINYKKNIPPPPPTYKFKRPLKPARQRLAASYDSTHGQQLEGLGNSGALFTLGKLIQKGVMRKGKKVAKPQISHFGQKPKDSLLKRGAEGAKNFGKATLKHAPMAAAFSAPSMLPLGKPKEPRPTVSGQQTPPNY